MLDAADWKCAHCDGGENTLHVHHKLYRKGAKPWEYEDKELIVLCANCHKSDHQLRDDIAEELARVGNGFFPQVIGYLRGLRIVNESYDEGVDLKEKIEMGGDFGIGVMDALNLHESGPLDWYGYQVAPGGNPTVGDLRQHHEQCMLARREKKEKLP